MEPVVGEVYEGKVTGITGFGAFVALPGGRSGLVHISEVASSYVNDIHDHLQIGQSVAVRVLAVTADGKINLSVRRAREEPKAQPLRREATAAPQPRQPPADQDFEARLKKFMQASDSKMADNPMYSDRKQRNRHK